MPLELIKAPRSRSGEKEIFGENHERVDGELTDFVDLEDRTKKSRVRASGNLLSTQQKGESVELSTRAMMAGDSCSFHPPASASSLPSFCRCELRRSAASSIRVRVKMTSRFSLHLSLSFHLSDLGSTSDSCRSISRISREDEEEGRSALLLPISV
ncbi:hypothetical protein LXL04_005953 [Taraxacum kok-saghyz]